VPLLRTSHSLLLLPTTRIKPCACELPGGAQARWKERQGQQREQRRGDEGVRRTDKDGGTGPRVCPYPGRGPLLCMHTGPALKAQSHGLRELSDMSLVGPNKAHTRARVCAPL